MPVYRTDAALQNEARIRLKVAIAAYHAAHYDGKLDQSFSKAIAFFAEYALVRSPRTVIRWLDGEAPVPQVVQRAVERIIEDHLPQ